MEALIDTLRVYYEKHAPNKANKQPKKLAREWFGREKELFEALKGKYGESPEDVRQASAQPQKTGLRRRPNSILKKSGSNSGMRRRRISFGDGDNLVSVRKFRQDEILDPKLAEHMKEQKRRDREAFKARRAAAKKAKAKMSANEEQKTLYSNQDAIDAAMTKREAFKARRAAARMDKIKNGQKKAEESIYSNQDAVDAHGQEKERGSAYATMPVYETPSVGYSTDSTDHFYEPPSVAYSDSRSTSTDSTTQDLAIYEDVVEEERGPSVYQNISMTSEKGAAGKVYGQEDETPMGSEDAEKETPLESEDVEKETPMGSEDAEKETPMESEDAEKETPLDSEDVVKETPSESEDVVKETPSESENVEKGTSRSTTESLSSGRKILQVSVQLLGSSDFQSRARVPSGSELKSAFEAVKEIAKKVRPKSVCLVLVQDKITCTKKTGSFRSSFRRRKKAKVPLHQHMLSNLFKCEPHDKVVVIITREAASFACTMYLTKSTDEVNSESPFIIIQYTHITTWQAKRLSQAVIQQCRTLTRRKGRASLRSTSNAAPFDVLRVFYDEVAPDTKSDEGIKKIIERCGDNVFKLYRMLLEKYRKDPLAVYAIHASKGKGEKVEEIQKVETEEVMEETEEVTEETQKVETEKEYVVLQ